MKQRNLFAGLAAAMISLLITGCGGAGGYGSSSGSGSGSSGSGSISTISISPASSTIAINATQQFMATAKDGNGKTITGVTYTWKSSASGIATINSNGLATGVAAGTTMITAVYNYSISGHPYTITSDQAKLTVSGMGMLMGTAAVGHAFVGALVTLKDTQGRTQYAVTDAQGRFAFATSGLASPYLLRVSDDQGHTMYSLADGDGVTNIDPFSEVMTQLWYRAHGTTVESAFATPGIQMIANNASFRDLDNALTAALAYPLAAHGLDSANTSLLNTPFAADGTGLDGLLDHTTFGLNGDQFLINNAETGSTITLSSARDSITIRTMNTKSSDAGAIQVLKF
jgi:hypothetical protein